MMGSSIGASEGNEDRETQSRADKVGHTEHALRNKAVLDVQLALRVERLLRGTDKGWKDRKMRQDTIVVWAP